MKLRNASIEPDNAIYIHSIPDHGTHARILSTAQTFDVEGQGGLGCIGVDVEMFEKEDVTIDVFAKAQGILGLGSKRWRCHVCPPKTLRSRLGPLQIPSQSFEA
mmetsp:Transcript_24135/g.54544  ORF Transcript_24135/g.54544 Transcript_24135/m.54544 type:complete len:104 (+) Transcript_24135:593-904(+)